MPAHWTRRELRAAFIGSGLWLLAVACFGSGLEPSADRVLAGAWASDTYVPAARHDRAKYAPEIALLATGQGAIARIGCAEYEVTEPIVLTRDLAFSAPTRVRAGAPAAPGYRLEGHLRADGGLTMYLRPPPPTGTQGKAVAFAVPLYQLAPTTASQLGEARTCGQ